MEYELGMLSSISASLYTQFANSFLVPTTDNMNYYHFQKPVILEPQTLRTRSITLSIIIQGCTFHGPTFLNNSGMMRERIGGVLGDGDYRISFTRWTLIFSSEN